MQLSTADLVLPPDAPIDLQLHTVYSDGRWTAEALIDHVKREGFGLIAITDHDRVDTAAAIQQLAIAKQMPVLVATEMSTSWRNRSVDMLCFGFDPGTSQLLADAVLQRQRENSLMVYETMRRNAGTKPVTDDEREAFALIMEMPSAQHPPYLGQFFAKYGYAPNEDAAWQLMIDAGIMFMTNDMAAVVDAVHKGGGVCLLAHPGRGEGFTLFDVNLLDELRQEIPIDGLEAYYPKHPAERVTMFVEYAERHNLLVSSGSDSHGPDKQFPVKYPAHLSRKLLERLGVRISA